MTIAPVPLRDVAVRAAASRLDNAHFLRGWFIAVVLNRFVVP